MSAAIVEPGPARFTHPAWRPYRPILRRLPGAVMQRPEQLTRLLPPQTRTSSGWPVRFVNQALLTPENYEQRALQSGVVSTRAGNLHDLCNALVWCRLPATKAAINHLHCHSRPTHEAGSRGALRDALTLLDESGLLVVSEHGPLLRALQRKDWQAAFVEHRRFWRHSMTLVCGHALLEKLLNPFKSITAKTLLIRLPKGHTVNWQQLDATLARQLMARRWLRRPPDLAPLPVAGIPGWWQAGRQDQHFYADQAVFRPPAAGFVAAPLRRWPAPGPERAVQQG